MLDVKYYKQEIERIRILREYAVVIVCIGKADMYKVHWSIKEDDQGTLYVAKRDDLETAKTEIRDIFRGKEGEKGLKFIGLDSL